jgi:anti-sigma B factor antagonist
MKHLSRHVRNLRCDVTSRSDPSRPDPSPTDQPASRLEGLCHVTLLRCNGQALLVVGGEIDLGTVQTLRNALREATAQSRLVVVELSNVSFIGAAGLDALVGAHQTCQLAGGRLRVRTTNRFISRLLSVAGLTHLANRE